MGARKKTVETPTVVRRTRPALTVEGRESQIAALAYDLVEQRILNGTATSQETTYFLKLGSSKERLEREMLKKQNELLQAKTESLKSAARIEALYLDAMKSFREYNGEDIDDQDLR